jgi:homoserine kinase
MKVPFDICKETDPASTSNLGPGFDVFGLGVDLFYDTVSIRKMSTTNGKIRITLDNNARVPSIVEENTATLAIRKIVQKKKIKNDLDIRIAKGVPIGLGLGSSAASSAAAITAFNELFQCKLTENDLLDFAAEGEVGSAGVKHYDNVVASLFGGFVVVRTFPSLEFIKIDTPKDLVMVVCVPDLITPVKKTEHARSVIPKKIPMEDHIRNLSNACIIVSGFFSQDTRLLSKGMNDLIVEPARKSLIPGYDQVKSNAISSGALAVTISGAGPSMIAFTDNTKNAREIGHSMEQGFARSRIQSRAHVCRPSGPARVISKS